MIQQAKLPIKIPIKQIQAEVLALSKGWRPHFNIRQYKGDWTVLPLRSPEGASEQIIPDLRGSQSFADTLLMESCPAINRLIKEFHCPIMAVRLMNLSAGSEIKEHRDHDLAFEKGEARLHIPIITNHLVAFYVDNVRVMMREGECWYINVNLPHKAANYGTTDRIHLVVDCVVDDWLKNLFVQAEVVEAKGIHQENETSKIIYELRLQNTKLSNRLADELEQQLGTRK
jgi:mannose-6-phosphate isomerase-like protein (cupin superfamily)